MALRVIPRQKGGARGTRAVRGLVFSCAVALVVPAAAGAYLSTRNISPFPSSKLIVGAEWTTRRYNPPGNQRGDILPTVWGDDGNEYTMMDDGGTNVPVAGGVWRQSFAQITGTPPKLQFHYVGDRYRPAAHTFAQIHANPSLWTGPLGPFYSSGLVEANQALFATQQYDWSWNTDGPFQGLEGIAYSLDRGAQWNFPAEHFPAPLGNLSWVIRGRGGFYPDGYVYAIGSEREFNASMLLIGRAKDDVADLTDPSKWQWASGWTVKYGAKWPVFSSSFANAVPVLSWRLAHHLSANGLRRTDPALPADLLLLVRTDAAGDLAQWSRAGDPGGAAPVGPVLIRRPRTRIRSFKRIRRGDPGQAGFRATGVTCGSNGRRTSTAAQRTRTAPEGTGSTTAGCT